MANSLKNALMSELSKRYGSIRKLGNGQSLYEIGKGAARVYIRYSKVHNRNRTFFGLRKDDLQLLEGFPSVLCFLWDGQLEPLFLPFSEYEEVFQGLSPAADGQYKVQIYLQPAGNELYIAGAGRFNVEAQVGWIGIDSLIDKSELKAPPELSHSQVQTLLGSIGATKGHGIWIPANDRNRMDWTISNRFNLLTVLPQRYDSLLDIISEIDVIWIDHGASRITALFEVEHSTPIYSGLLRLNDVYLAAPSLGARYSVVSNDERRALFVRNLNRPTFRASRLSEVCTFLEYIDVFSWHRRLASH